MASLERLYRLLHGVDSATRDGASIKTVLTSVFAKMRSLVVCCGLKRPCCC